MISEKSFVSVDVSAGVGTVTFASPKANSLSTVLIDQLVHGIKALSGRANVRVILLQSVGDQSFCAGASFDELQSLQEFESAKKFFLGFARIILAIRESPKFVVARVQGKAVGGGVGVIAASDYAVAASSASVRLSEFALGFGPFVIGPVVERKVGGASFAALATDTDWRSAQWGWERGLYARVVESLTDLDTEVTHLITKLSQSSQEATRELKRVFWEGTEHYETVLSERAGMSARLWLQSAHRKTSPATGLGMQQRRGAATD